MPKAALRHTYEMVYFLRRKGKVSLQSMNGSTASLQVTRLCFFDTACALEVGRASDLLPQQRSLP